ncbi:MAG: mitochondrial ribosomal protein L37-domain-containing protein [Monoraphidium minutum]|nr:MAG: mitochondrial ribosomal protein L37-domain-containing protein [Monoraphidium minutum]
MQGLRARVAALVAQRLRGLPPGGAKKRVADKGPAKVGELSAKVATGVAIRKGEADPPLLPDDQYPPWLFDMLTPEPSTAELQRLYEQDGLTLAQMKRLFRYKNKQRIREANEARAKK